MTVELVCDFCGEPIGSPVEPFARLTVTGTHCDDEELIHVHRDYHAGERGDDASCLARALRLLDGGDVPASGLPAGWDHLTQLGELDLPARVVRVLRGAGVETVAQLADRRALGGLGGVRGIGARALASIDEVLAHGGAS